MTTPTDDSNPPSRIVRMLQGLRLRPRSAPAPAPRDTAFDDIRTEPLRRRTPRPE